VLTFRAPRPTARVFAPDAVAAIAVAAILIGVVTVVATRLNAGIAVAAPLLLLACLFLVFNPRIEVSLAIAALYIGLLDGYLKLSTGSSLATLGRDLLLYAIVVGSLLRLAISDRPVTLPKYTAHVMLFVAIVLAQTLNPATPGAKAAIGGLRQHLEFVPLFFFGFACMRSQRRLQAFLVLLLAVAAANAVVAAIQFNLTPQQLAGWGPGYSERILGQGAFRGGARIFSDATGAHVRPFGLGSDLGAAGVVGWSAIPAALAFIAVPRSPRLRICGVIGFLFCVIAVITSQSRAVVLAAVFVPLAFAALSVTGKNATRGLITLMVSGLLIYVAVDTFVQKTDSHSLSRLQTLQASQLRTTVGERGGSASLIPVYAARYPLGAGVGRSGPAAGFGGSASTLNAENEPNFLIAEIGTVGFLVLLTLWLRVIIDGVRSVRRITDVRSRLLMAALIAPVLGSALVWYASTPTVSTPIGPLFWFVAGVVAWVATQGADAFADGDGASGFSPSRTEATSQ
jgi:hypothetical protein